MKNFIEEFYISTLFIRSIIFKMFVIEKVCWTTIEIISSEIGYISFLKSISTIIKVD